MKGPEPSVYDDEGYSYGHCDRYDPDITGECKRCPALKHQHECHSGCLHHTILSTSHHPDCPRQQK